jgi:glycosyltransferase involved in cell wall biosynthesis
MKLEIICPVFNEESVIATFLTELSLAINQISSPEPLEIGVILVDDGSSDATVKTIKTRDFGINVKLICLTRNFGHQNAVWAGLESVEKDSFCIVMDSDLQDPPSEIHKIINGFNNGYEVVLMQRKSRKDKFVKAQMAKIYYKIHENLSDGSATKNVGDFFGLSPRALGALLQHKESIKYIRGLVSQIGFRKLVITYERQQRRSGYTHYTVSKMFGLAIAGITGFSIKPLIWVVKWSIFGVIIGLSFCVYVVVLKISDNQELTPGWTFAVASSTLFSVMILMSLSVISIYLARIVQELKNRPVYIIDERLTE